MQNEERINGLETQVRTLKRIVCLVCCLALITQIFGCNAEVEYDTQSEEVPAKNNGLSYRVSFIPSVYETALPSCYLQVEFNGNNLPSGNIATMEMVDPLTGEILAYDELIVDEHRSKKGGSEVKLLFVQKRVKDAELYFLFLSDEIYRGKYNLDWLEINFLQMTPVEGDYKDGKKYGKWTVWDENGQKKSDGNYKDDKKYSKWTVWDENGQIRSEENYKYDKKDGKWTSWYENGQKKSEGNYKDDKKDGKWTEWHENGNKRTERNYKDGKKQSEENYKDDKKDGKWTEWDENGQKQSEESYKDGKLDGKLTWWWENGQKKSEANYKDGKLDGKWTWWWENGQMWRERNYKDGLAVD